MVAVVFKTVKAFLLTATLIVVGLLGSTLYIMFVLKCQLHACHIETMSR